MFGLLCLFKERGDEINLIVATDGSLGSSNPTSNLSKIRANETKDALKEFSIPKLLKIKDGELGNEFLHQKLIHYEINKINPDLIVTHSQNDYHPDHRALSRIVKSIAGIYYPLLFADNFVGIDFNPNYYVDISDFFSKKKLAIQKHKSQFPEKYVELVEIWNRFRSIQCNGANNTYAEAYRFEASFPFSDIRSLLPKPPKINATSLKKSGGLI